MEQVEGLFPTPLLRTRGLFETELVWSLIAHIRDAQTSKNSRSELLSHTEIVRPEDNPLYRRVTEIVVPKLADFGMLLFGGRLGWTVKEMWTNVLAPGGSQSMHAHANSFASGILYLTPSHHSAHTVFVRNPAASEFIFRHDAGDAQIGPFNAGKWVTPDIEPGDMVLFPSYLLHEVPPNRGGERITIAFNAMPGRLDSHGYTIGFQP